MYLISRNPDPAAVLEEANADDRTLAKPRCNLGSKQQTPGKASRPSAASSAPSVEPARKRRFVRCGGF
jgi:hypothetical protein